MLLVQGTREWVPTSLLLQSSRKCSESSCQFCCTASFQSKVTLVIAPTLLPPKPSKNTNLGKYERKFKAASDLEKEIFFYYFFNFFLFS